MKVYDSMKNSGVPWLGLIPSDWRIERGKNILTLLNRATKDDDDVVTCFRDGEVTLRKNRREEGFTISLKETGYQGIEPGDLVVHGMDGFAGAIGISDSRGKGTPVLNVMDSDQNKKYLMYYLRALSYRDVFMALSTGIRVRSCDLRWNKLATLPFLVPSLDEQNAIVKHIDEVNFRINTLIEETKVSIDEHKQRKASIISELTLGKLTSGSALEPSGLEWIKEIPQGWSKRRLKTLYDFGKGLPITKADLVKSGIPVISYGQIHSKVNTGVTVDDELLRFVPESFLQSNPEALVYPGDFIFADTSEDHEGCGNAVLIDREGALFAGYHTIVIRPKQKMYSKYLAYLFRTDEWRSQIRSRVTGVKLYSISKKILSDTSVVIPPEDQQRMIVKALDDRCAKIDLIIQEKTKLLLDLEQYKKSMVYEIVTGKRKVV